MLNSWHKLIQMGVSGNLHYAVAKGSQITVDNAYLYWTHVSVHWN